MQPQNYRAGHQSVNETFGNLDARKVVQHAARFGAYVGFWKKFFQKDAASTRALCRGTRRWQTETFWAFMSVRVIKNATTPPYKMAMMLASNDISSELPSGFQK